MAEIKHASKSNLTRLFHQSYADQNEINEAMDKDLDNYEAALLALEARVPSVTYDEGKSALIVSIGGSGS